MLFIHWSKSAVTSLKSKELYSNKDRTRLGMLQGSLGFWTCISRSHLGLFYSQSWSTQLWKVNQCTLYQVSMAGVHFNCSPNSLTHLTDIRDSKHKQKCDPKSFGPPHPSPTGEVQHRCLFLSKPEISSYQLAFSSLSWQRKVPECGGGGNQSILYSSIFPTKTAYSVCFMRLKV